MTANEVLTAVMLRLNVDGKANVQATDYQTRQLVGFMNEAGADIARRVEWSRLYRSAETDGGKIWALPEDFDRMAEAGAVMRKPDGAFYRIVTSPTLWAWLMANPSAQPYCQIAEGTLMLRPDPKDGIVVRYLSREWAGNGPRITSGDVDLAIPGRLLASGTVYRALRQKGFPYDDVLAEHEADLLDDAKADRGAA